MSPKKPSLSVAIFWPSNPTTNLHCGCSGFRSPINLPAAPPIATGKRKRIFQSLSDPYERLYYTGIVYERRAKAQLRAGQPANSLLPLFEQALRFFAEAETIRPEGNDDAILRWNRCARLLQTITYLSEQESAPFDAFDSPPAPAK